MQAGDLVRFTPDVMTYGVDDEGLIGMIGLVTEVVPVAGAAHYALVRWSDGEFTDTILSDLALVQRACAVVE